MATDFGAAKDQVNESKRAMLEAMARYGSEGKARFEAARGNVQAAQQEAVQRALASRVGGTPAGTRGFEDVYGRNLASLSSLQAGSEQNLAAHSAANSSYFDKINAALPVVQSRMDEDFAKSKAELERELAVRQQGIEGMIAAQQKENEERRRREEAELAWEREKQQFEREKMAMERAKLAREAAGGGSSGGGESADDLSDAELAGRLIGAARTAEIESVSPALNPRAHGPLAAGQTWASETPLETRASNIGVSAGLDANRVRGLSRLQPPKAPTPVEAKNIMSWANTDQKTAQTIAKDKDYVEARDWAYQQILEGVPWAEVVDTFSGNFLDRGKGKAKKTRTYAALVQEFLPMFRAADLVNVDVEE